MTDVPKTTEVVIRFLTPEQERIIEALIPSGPTFGVDAVRVVLVGKAAMERAREVWPGVTAEEIEKRLTATSIADPCDVEVDMCLSGAYAWTWEMILTKIRGEAA